MARTVKVNPDGNAPKGLVTGDKVVTGVGVYQITGFNSDGSYKSKKVSETNTGNYGGYSSSNPQVEVDIQYPDGSKGSGYIQDGKTYLIGGGEVPVGTIVKAANGKYYKKTENEGVEVGSDSWTSPSQPKFQQPPQQQITQTDDLWNIIDDLLSQIGNNQYKAPVYTPPAIEYLTEDEARTKAEELLLPLFTRSKTELENDMAKIAAKRGIDTSATGLRLSSDAMADLEARYNSNLSGLMQQLMAEDKNNANIILDRAYNEWMGNEQVRQNAYNANMNSLNNQLSMLFNLLGLRTNTALSEAQLTGNYNGTPTLASRQFDAQENQRFIDNYGYNPDTNEITLNGRKFNSDQAMADFQKAEVMASLTGRVYGLSAYGIPDGTPVYGSGGSSQLNPSLAMAIWEQTGKAPTGLEAYGIKPGTLWTGTGGVPNPEQVAFEQQEWFKNRSNEISSKYGVSKIVSDIVTSVLDPVTSGNSPEAMWQTWLIERETEYLPLVNGNTDILNQAERIIKQELNMKDDPQQPGKTVWEYIRPQRSGYVFSDSIDNIIKQYYQNQ